MGKLNNKPQLGDCLQRKGGGAEFQLGIYQQLDKRIPGFQGFKGQPEFGRFQDHFDQV